MALSKEDFDAFFRAKKNGTYKCPFCSHEVFVVNGLLPPATDNPAKLVLHAEDDEKKDLGSHQFYSVACANCGHSDFFHIHQINAFLASRKDG